MQRIVLFSLCAALGLSGCQTVQPVTDDSGFSETTLSTTDVGLDESALYDPLAIVGELGEAEDSPAVAATGDRPTESVLSETALAPVNQGIWGEIIEQFQLPGLKDTQYADLHRKRLTHQEGVFLIVFSEIKPLSALCVAGSAKTRPPR